MKANIYHDAGEHEKCQCITFDEQGKIVGSCDTLFRVTGRTAAAMRRQFPILEKIISHFTTHAADTSPVFIPQVEFECNGYYSVCDFTFMQSQDAHGLRKFIWMIYDNSIHYRELLRGNASAKSKRIPSVPITRRPGF